MHDTPRLAFLRSRRLEIGLVAGLLVVAAGVRLPGLFSRSIWHDEAITLLETAGHASPSWPREPTLAREARENLAGTPSLGQIAADLRRTDAHPPVYYWCLALWRRTFGFSLETARAFSLVASLAAVLAWYLLLRAGKAEQPWALALIFAVSTVAVHCGHEARSFALASLQIVLAALFAYLAIQAPESKMRTAILAPAAGAACGLAFLTNYLALFPAVAILLFLSVHLGRRSPRAAVAAPLVALAVAISWLPALREQMAAPPPRLRGFVGLGPELAILTRLNLAALWAPPPSRDELGWAAIKVLLVVLVLDLLLVLVGVRRLIAQLRKALAQARTERFAIEPPLRHLVLALAAAPTLGLLVLDAAGDRRLHLIRYMVFSAPPLAAIVGAALVRFTRRRRRVGMVLVAGIVGLQLTAVNWGAMHCHPGFLGNSGVRRVVGRIHASLRPSHVVIIGAGYGRGFPASVVYELDPEVRIVVLGPDASSEQLRRDVGGYEDLWILSSGQEKTAASEYALLRQVEESGDYTVVWRSTLATHFRKLAATVRAAQPTPQRAADCQAGTRRGLRLPARGRRGLQPRSPPPRICYAPLTPGRV